MYFENRTARGFQLLDPLPELLFCAARGDHEARVFGIRVGDAPGAHPLTFPAGGAILVVSFHYVRSSFLPLGCANTRAALFVCVPFAAAAAAVNWP
jgi:hypothetical protein